MDDGVVRDLSHLPKAAPEREGWLPDATPRFGVTLVDRWHREGIASDDEWAAAGGGARFRHSLAAACSRMVAYYVLRIPESNPMDPPGHYVTRLGQWMHEQAQAAISERYPGTEVEIHVDLLDGVMGGHADVEVVEYVEDPGGDWEKHDHKIVSIEIKSLGGYAYKQAIGERGPAIGPKHEHVVQASLNAKARDATEAVLLYLSREAVSVQAAQRAGLNDYERVMAEWTLDRATYEPIADREIERIKAIVALVDDGTLPARKIPTPELPASHVIVNPRSGAWTSEDANGQIRAGTWWACGYCRWQDTCAMTEAGRSPVDQLVSLGVLRDAGD